MHDIPLTQVQAEGYLPQIQPRSPSLAQHLGQVLQLSALSLAPFASQVVALDESTFDRLRRLTTDLRDVPTGDPHLLPGKLAGLFDLRLQRWLRVQFRAAVLASCNTGIMLLLDRYLTNVLSPTPLSMREIAQLYARRWDIELAFKLLKCELGLHLWWGALPELVLIQLWLALILAQLLHALQLQVALQAAHSDSFVPPAVSRWSCHRLSHTCSVRPLISRTSRVALAMPNAILIPDTLLSSLASQLNFSCSCTQWLSAAPYYCSGVVQYLPSSKGKPISSRNVSLSIHDRAPFSQCVHIEPRNSIPHRHGGSTHVA